MELRVKMAVELAVVSAINAAINEVQRVDESAPLIAVTGETNDRWMALTDAAIREAGRRMLAHGRHTR